jgi:hypothetical protein
MQVKKTGSLENAFQSRSLKTSGKARAIESRPGTDEEGK